MCCSIFPVQNTIQHVLNSFIPTVLIVDISHCDALDYTGLHVLFAMAQESKHLRVKLVIGGADVRVVSIVALSFTVC